jgi:predicted acylesterase/phospholipase RssA
MWKPSVLFIGSDGFYGLTTIGAIVICSRDERLGEVKTYSGIGSGAVISLLLAAGYTIQELVKIVVDFEFFTAKVDIPNVLGALISSSKSGIFSDEGVETILKKLITDKLGLVPSLSTFYSMTNIHYTTFGFNEEEKRTEIISDKTHPDISCVLAALTGMRKRMLFKSTLINGNHYTGLSGIDPYPITLFDPNEKLLGIYIHLDSLKDGFLISLANIMSNKDISYTCWQRTVAASPLSYRHLSLSIKNVKYDADHTKIEKKERIKTAALETERILEGWDD